MFLQATSALYIINHAPGSHVSKKARTMQATAMDDFTIHVFQSREYKCTAGIRHCLVTLMLFTPALTQISKTAVQILSSR